MASYNRIIIMGNLTRDPEYKQLQSGQSVCRLGVASNRQFKNKQTGSVAQEVCFVDVDVWGAQAESCNQFLQKGRPVLIEGRLKLDSWQDNDGNKRSKHSIVADRVTFLSGSSAQDEDSASEPTADSANSSSNEYVAAKPADDAKKTIRRAVKPATSQSNMGEVALKNDAPFEDDLPF